MASRNRQLFEEDSDEDSINTNTTASDEGDPEAEYLVEEILAEEADEYGRVFCLIKWAGYELYASTWEPKSELSGAILQDWESRKLAIAHGEAQPFDTQRHSQAVEDHEEEKEQRRQRRQAKRLKRAQRSQRPRIDTEEGSECEDELTRPHPSRPKTARAVPVARKGVAQRSTKQQSKDSGKHRDGDVLSEGETSDVDSASLFFSNEPTVAPTSPTKRKDDKVSNATSEKVSTAAAPVQPNTTQSTPQTKESAQQIISSELSSLNSGTASATAARMNPGPNDKVKVPATNSSLPTSMSTDAGAKKPPVQRQRARLSGETRKDSAAPKFATLSIQNRYQKYSKNEPPPDPSALRMVDPKTGNVEPPPATAIRRNGPTEIHRAYARRTPSPERKRKSATPPRAPSSSRRRSEPQVTVPVRPELMRTTTNPLKQSMCRFWQAGNCQFTADTCRYAHAVIEPPKKQITCYYWARGGTCKKTEAECDHAHRYTGIDAIAPSQAYVTDSVQPDSDFLAPKKQTTCYYWMSDNGCRKSAEECQFAHFDTGIYAGPPGTAKKRRSSAFYRPDSLIDPSVPHEPPSQTKFPQPVALTERNIVASPEHVNSTAHAGVQSPKDFLNSNLMEWTRDESDRTQPASAFKRSERPPESLNKDPRLRNRAPRPSDMMPSHASDKAYIPGGRVKTDLEMAKEGCNALDGSILLGTKKEPIQNVFIHMLPDRKDELKILVDFFEKLRRTVYTSSSSDPNIWNFFRKQFGKSCLIVLHPTELFVQTLPGLHEFIYEYGSGVRVFSIGVQRPRCIREQREPAYEAQRLFPHGSIYFISDDIFVYYPEKATEIIDKFLKETKNKPLGAETSKIGARPGVKDWMVRLALKKFEEQGGAGHCTDLRWIACYEALGRLCPPEDEDPNYPERQVPLESSHLWSVDEDSMQSFKGRWESGDEEGATEYMVNFFAGEACSKAWKYRKFFFVYQRPGNERQVESSQGLQVVQQQVDPKGWMSRYCHIGVCTPDQALMAIRGKR